MKVSSIIIYTGWLMGILDMIFGKAGSMTVLLPTMVICTGLIIQAIEDK